MGSTNLKGINEDLIDKLVLDMYDYTERINNILNSIDNLVNETSKFYVCESGNKFRNHFEETKLSFPVINQNMLSYADDLITAKASTRNFSGQLSAKITNSINDFDIYS